MGLTKSFYRMRGFTLVELMIAMVILVILAGVGYPLYQDQVRKARRTDARSAAMQIAMAEEQYYTRKGSYTADFTDDDLNLDSDLQDKTSAGGYYDLAIIIPTNDTFRVEVTPATGKSQVKDTDCKKFIINQAGSKTSEGDNTRNCW